MQKSIVVAASLLFVVASAFAQQPSRSNSVSVFVSDLSISGSSTNGTRVDAAYGAAFDHMFNDRLSGELSVTSQRVRRLATTLDSLGVPTTVTASDRLYPVDATLTYHFFTESRWKPYFGTGVRYVSDTFQALGPNPHRIATHSLNPEVSGGVVFQFNPTLGLRMDVKQVIGGNVSRVADRDSKASVGLSLRF